MKGKTAFRTAQIACPFFRNHSANAVGCEGITDDSTLTLAFYDRENLRRHERIFCADRFENCELYRAIALKYEEENEP